MSIRAPANEYISEITASLLSKIKEKSTDDDFDVESISLYGIDDIDSRNEFFQRLIEGLENMEVVNVSDVAVYNPVTGDDDAIGVHVKKASLNSSIKRDFLYIVYLGLLSSRTTLIQIYTISKLSLMTLNIAEIFRISAKVF